MNKFFVFISDNFLAVLVLLTLIAALIIYERRKGSTKVDNSEMTRLINKVNPFIYDLRSSAEYGAGTVAGAMNLEPSNLLKEDALFKGACHSVSSSSSHQKEHLRLYNPAFLTVLRL